MLVNTKLKLNYALNIYLIRINFLFKNCNNYMSITDEDFLMDRIITYDLPSFSIFPYMKFAYTEGKSIKAY